MRGLALAVFVLALGCSTSAVTEIIVVTDTDLSVPDELDAIRISVTDAQFQLQEAVADLAGGAPRPVTLGLVSQSGEGTLEVVVIGERGGIEILRRTARVRFERGRTLVLRMDLWDRCIAEICGAERACGDAGCRPVDIDPSELSEWTGTPPGPPDAAVMPDGGPDGGVIAEDGDVPEDAAEPMDGSMSDAWSVLPDAGPPVDGGIFADAGMPDDAGSEPDAWVSECSGDGECNDGWTCTADTCTAGRCVHAPSDASCDDGIACTTERCDLALGCVYDASDALCSDGVACSVDTCDRSLGCVRTLAHSSCGLGSYCDATGGCTAGPTFATIYTTILATECGPCHITSPSRGGDLDLGSQSAAYAAMVGVTATCGAGVNTRVIPRDPSRSLLWRKIAGVDLCGTRMPRMSTPLSDADIEMIRQWIEAGAME